jgi:tetratricopeptide (TPR) repeat protein
MSEEGDWVMIGLDQKMSRRQGIPAQLPVPRAEFEGLAEKGLNIDKARAWIKDFLNNSEAGKSGVWRKKNSAVVGALEAFLDKTPLWEKSQAAFAANDYEKAIASLKRIAAMDQDDHAARLNLASAYANMRDFPQALKAFKDIRKTFEGDPDYHVALGHVHIAMQDKDSAANELVLALEAKPDCQPALDALVQLRILTPVYENPRDAASLTYVRADSVLPYLEGVWDAPPAEAAEGAPAPVAKDGAYFLEQLAYHEREMRHDVVLGAAERAVKAGGGERAELARIGALRSLGRLDDALAAAQAYAEKAPASAPAQVELAKTLSAAGKNEEGNAAIARALELDPGDLQALSFRFWPADVTELQKVNDAIPALKAFAEAHPGSAGVWRSLARAYLIVQRTDEALDLFAKTVALSPADDDLRAEHWAELGKLQRFSDILADAGHIADMNAHDWKLRWNEAEAYLGIGKKVEARAAFSAINFDETLHVDVRKRAKRAVKAIDEGGEAPPA